MSSVPFPKRAGGSIPTLFSFLFFSLTTLADGIPKSTILFGTLHHTKLNQDQLAELNLIPLEQVSGKQKVAIILKLHFGGFDSKEYLTYHFSALYSPANGMLYPDNGTEDLLIRPFALKYPFNEMKAKIESVIGGGEVGTLEMSTEETVIPKAPLIQSVWAEYRGNCDGQEKALQMRTFRSSTSLTPVGNPFGSYEIVSVYAEHDERMELICGKGNPLCIKGSSGGATYNYFTGEIKTFGGRLAECSIDATGIVCGGCRYDRTQATLSGTGVPYKRPTAKSMLPAETLPTTIKLENLDGAFVGYLHHEFLDQYQNLRISFSSIPTTDPRSFTLTSLASLSFGEAREGEIINYRLTTAVSETLTLPLPVGSFQSDSDAVFLIEQADENSLRGTWYSRHFGRVGSFYAGRKGPALPDTTTVMDPINGVYSWIDLDSPKALSWRLTLPIISSGTGSSTTNPFFPLTFAGFYDSLERVIPRQNISGGSYDFYTGRIIVGGIFVGERLSREQMYLQYVTGRNSTPLRPIWPDHYRYEGPVN